MMNAILWGIAISFIGLGMSGLFGEKMTAGDAMIVTVVSVVLLFIGGILLNFGWPT